ncbi:MAG: hypothetical protein IT236_15530 [Bacteroidia bacterium]|nr:hypothetical protein [Bacteroidia bacterium]
MINERISKSRHQSVFFATGLILWLCLANPLQAQLSFQGPYLIKNNTKLAVCINFTVSCNEGKITTEAKMISILPGSTYTVPAPFFNSVRFYADGDIHIQIVGTFGSEVVNFKHQSSRYNEDMGWFTSSNPLQPQGVIVWTPSITNIW